MKILVIGSTGFLGSQLCKTLVDQGHHVRAFHRATSSLKGLDPLGVEHALGDLRDLNSLVDAMQGVEVVFHVAALVGAEKSISGQMYAVSVEGTRHVLQAALEVGVERLVHTSSVAALGIPEKGPFSNGSIPVLNENHTWNSPPQGYPYGHAKYLAELEVQNAVARGLDAVIINPSGVFGAGDVYRSSNSIIMQVKKGRFPVAIAGGWNVIHVDDVSAGHLEALERGQKGERYILGGTNMTFSYFLEMIAEVTGAPAPGMTLPAWSGPLLGSLVRIAQPFVELPASGTLLRLAGRHFYYTTAKAERVLGWRPSRSARQAIEDAYGWFKGVEAGTQS